jgi:hypothetical protein
LSVEKGPATQSARATGCASCLLLLLLLHLRRRRCCLRRRRCSVLAGTASRGYRIFFCRCIGVCAGVEKKRERERGERRQTTTGDGEEGDASRKELFLRSIALSKLYLWSI